MTKVYSKALDETIEVERIIGHIKGEQPGPTLIFMSGVHGNEPSGVFALHKVFQELKENNTLVKGNIYAISGNLWALERGERYHTHDLNRQWTKDKMELLENGKLKEDNEDIAQQIDIYNTIKNILNTESGPFYFMDLHTTSSETMPFLTVNDSLLNRKFTMQYPVPLILGIEEYLDGPILSYINELGYVAFGYEGGQHDDLASIENHIAFTYLSLVFAGSISKADIDFNHYYLLLAKTSLDSRDIYEIYWRYEIKKEEAFTMKPGFINFQRIHKDQEIATSNGKTIRAAKRGRIFMPLYQSQGDDGFFAIRRILPFSLRLSATLRRFNFHNRLHWLPGVRWVSKEKEALMVNRRVARFFTKEFFHLLGYRSKRIDKTHLVMRNRETASRTKEYTSAPWS